MVWIEHCLAEEKRCPPRSLGGTRHLHEHAPGAPIPRAGWQQAQGLLRQALPWTEGRGGVEMHQVVAEPSQSIPQHRYKPVCQERSFAPRVSRPTNSSNPSPEPSLGALLPPTKAASDSGDAGSDGRGCHGQCHPTPWLSSPGDPWHSTRLVAAEPARGRIRSSAFGSPRIGVLACDSRFT